VPFEVVLFKESKGGGVTKPPKRHRVYALPEKTQFEIRFPRVEGYRQAIRNRVTVDWEDSNYVPGTQSYRPRSEPGRARLSTKPLPTGSATITKMTGDRSRLLQHRRSRRCVWADEAGKRRGLPAPHDMGGG